jgi:hypothetical protein
MQVNHNESVSPCIHEMLEELRSVSVERPPRLDAIKKSLVRILTFLASHEGRTDANCSSVNDFILIDENWARPWDELPPPFADVFSFMSEALHDTVSAPDVAENFGCTPEQILKMAQALAC